MEFLLLIILVGFAAFGVIKATRARRASGHRAFGTTGHGQTPGAEPTFDVGGGHSHSSSDDSSSSDSSSSGD
ncbi:hypothetical protein [Paractinoplanes lichenicola]|uniref:Secreted protein n=1 Tax=Paractinoplanes lichenicola TaxID=2802976 RepID=A0ABS1VXX5_9ACTN|nr:hypothetical protein [Actinoplanes lichenicola]MBL7259342.1 hypothetical protein [Actinoplanes lichenicola]